MSSDQRSPKISSEIFTGKPDQRCEFGFDAVGDKVVD
jgi:hypothetical protein